MDEKIDLTRIDDYNNEPVYYCKNCLSLSIMELTDDISFCDRCGNTEIGICHIDEWEKLYREKYGRDHIKHKKIDINI